MAEKNRKRSRANSPPRVSTTSRKTEFFSVDELTKQIGAPPEKWATPGRTGVDADRVRQCIATGELNAVNLVPPKSPPLAN